MTNAISLRMATPEDTNEITALDPEHAIYQFPSIIRLCEYHFITAAVDESSGAIVGMIVDTKYKLHSLFVLPEYRRRGIATMLVQHIWDTNTYHKKHWIIPATTLPILNGVRLKLKNIGLYGFEMFTLLCRSCGIPVDPPCRYVVCVFYADPSLLGRMTSRSDDHCFISRTEWYCRTRINWVASIWTRENNGRINTQ